MTHSRPRGATPAGPPTAAAPHVPPPSSSGRDWSRWRARARAGLGADSVAQTRRRLQWNAQASAAVPSGRRIVGVGLDGGAGCTTVTALVALVMAARRHDPVLLVDATAPSWHPRLDVVLTGTNPDGPTLQSLAARPPVVRARSDIAAVLPEVVGRVSFVPQSTGDRAAAPGPDAYTAAVRPFSRFFDFTLTDLGADPVLGTTELLIEQAHALFIVAPAQERLLDGLEGRLQVLRQRAESWVDRTVIVINGGVGKPERRALRSPIGRLRDAGSAVFVLPADPTLTGVVPLRLSQIRQSTADAALRITGSLLGTAVGDAAAPTEAAVPRSPSSSDAVTVGSWWVADQP